MEKLATIVEVTRFLTEQLARDEEQARRAAFGWGAEWTAHRDDDGDIPWATVSTDRSTNVLGSEDLDVVTHAARHDPARVLADVEAKRKIIDICLSNGSASAVVAMATAYGWEG